MKFPLLPIAFMLVSGLSGCAVIEPFVQDYNVIPLDKEIKIGETTKAEIARQMTIVQDPAQTARVRTAGARLVAALPQKDYPYEFFVVADKSPNAFTVPGGKIYVHTGLIDFARSDDELAGVMAHEIGHAVDRHPAKAMSRAYGADVLSGLLFKGNQTQLKAMAAKLAASSILTRYGREDEFKADEIGYYLLKRSGYRTDGLVSFFRRLQTLERGGSRFQFMSTHPPTPERIARLEALDRGAITVSKPQAG